MDNTVQVQISAIDNSKEAFASLTRNLDTVEKATQSTSEKLIGLAPKFKAMATTGAVAFTGLSVALGASVRGAIEAESAQIRLATILRTTGGATEAQIEALNAQAQAMERLGVVSADNVTVAQSQLATFDLTADTIEKLTPAILDYAVAEKGASVGAEDLKAMTNGLAQALQGNFGSLTRTGFVLDEATKEMIANGTEAERASALVDVLNSTYKDFNETARQTTEGQAIALRNEMGRISDAIGNALIPAMTQLTEKLAPVVTKIADFAEKNPRLTQGIVAVTLGLSGLLVVIGTLGLILPPIIAGFGLLATAVGAVTLPMIAIGAVIAGVGFALYKLYQNWDEVLAFVQTKSAEVWGTVTEVFNTAVQAISTAVSSVWETIKTVFATSINFLVGLVAVFLDYLVPNWDVALVAIYNKLSEILLAMREYLAGKLQELATVFSEWATFFGAIWAEVWESIKATFTTVWDSIKAIFEGVISGIKSGLDTLVAPIEKVIKLAERAISLAKEVGGKVTSSARNTISDILSRGSSITGIGGKALGGGVTANTPYIVGERGRELFVPSTSGQIVPNNKLGVGEQAQAPNITINISGTFMDDRASARRLANEVMSVLSKNQRLPA